MPEHSYPAPYGGLPPQEQLVSGRAIFTTSYAVIPRGCMTSIVASHLPHWRGTRLWLLARPLSGFAETFSQYLMEVEPGGGSDRPEEDEQAQSVLFVMAGEITIELAGERHVLPPGGYAYLPPGGSWTIANQGGQLARFHWIRKRYAAVEGLSVPEAIFTHEDAVTPSPMPDTQGRWTTTRFVDPDDMRHDMQVNIVSLAPGAAIPFAETHVMEHGIYILQGKGVYRLNADWVEVEAGDFIWLRAWCPQACYAGGDQPFRYLLYRDINRHARLWPA